MATLSALQKARILKMNPGAVNLMLFIRELEAQYRRKLDSMEERRFKGERGERGPAGERGGKGEKGEKGERGERGKTGNDGSPGESVDKDGLVAEILRNIGTPKVPSLETLVTLAVERLSQKRIAVADIEGLRETLSKIQQNINTVKQRKDKGRGGGGGGMGNWVHQQFSVSSSTTSITLSSDVAAAGTAIILRYQGQMLAHGVQYTIAGKTVTFVDLNFADSTTVDASYVRT